MLFHLIQEIVNLIIIQFIAKNLRFKLIRNNFLKLQDIMSLVIVQERKVKDHKKEKNLVKEIN